MSEQQLKTMACPSCGNINPFTADECIKCGLALGPIREAMVEAGALEGAEVISEPAKPKEPPPPMPELPARPTTEEMGDYVDSWRFLIRGMGDRAEEIAARFFKQLAERGIEGLKLSIGRLIIQLEGGKTDSRGYYFAERDLGKSALATMAVRIAPLGTDLFVEWRHYTTPPLGAFHSGYFWAITIAAGVLGAITGSGEGFAIVLFGGLILAVVVAYGKARKPSLEGFQSQDSTAFQLAVRAALEEAIDLAGISKALIQELPKEEGEGRRVI
jgi:hypothetical protein